MSSKVEIVVVAKDNATKTLNSIGGSLTSLGSTAAKAGIALGAALGVTVAGGFAAAGVAGLKFNNSMEQVEAQLFAFLKDGELVAETLDMIRDRASKTPFAFEDMARAVAALTPAAKQSGQDIEELIGLAEILAASNPAEGLEGAAFSLREAMSGDMTSIIERFNLSRSSLNALKEDGVPALEAVSRAMKEMGLDTSLVTNLAETAEGRWSTFKDTLQSLFATATGSLFDRISEGLGRVNAILSSEDVQAKLEGIAIAIGDKLAAAADWIATDGAALFNQGWSAVRDSVTTFKEGFAGEWEDDAIIRPIHRFVGRVATAFGEIDRAFAPVLEAVRVLGSRSVEELEHFITTGETRFPALETILGTLDEALDELGLDSIPSVKEAFENLQQVLDILYPFVEQLVRDAVKGLSGDFKILQKTLDDFMGDMASDAGTWDQFITDLQMVAGWAKQVEDWLNRAMIAAQNAGAAIRNFFSISGSLPGGAPYDPGGTPQSPYSGARALGGPVLSGGTYLVGERGPELFTPQSSGSIIPNDKIGGGMFSGATIVLNNGLDIEQLAYQITRIQQRRTA